MACTKFLKARVSPEIKGRAKVVADHEFLSEAAGIRRQVGQQRYLALRIPRDFLCFLYAAYRPELTRYGWQLFPGCRVHL
jgi:hypothetical protein